MPSLSLVWYIFICAYLWLLICANGSTSLTISPERSRRANLSKILLKMIRKARISDVKEIQRLINYYASRDLMLPRSLNELYENLRDYFVYEENGKILGTCALHICWEDLAEIKSLAVEESKQRHGIGSSLLNQALKEAKDLNIKRLFVLTYEPEFFLKFGFKEVDKAKLPQKIWGECINCVKFPNCQEVALIKNIVSNSNIKM